VTDQVLLEMLKKFNKKQSAKFPISISVLRQVPFFTDFFSENEEILKELSQLADPDKNSFIRYKNFKPKEIIVHQGDVENTVFWLLKGTAVIRSGDRILIHIKPVTCFGEQTIVGSQGRTATVEVTEDSDADVVEIDWSITELDDGLRSRFLELLLKSTTDKLKTAYMISDRMWKGARDQNTAYKKRIHGLKTENEILKTMNNALKEKLGL
jgi:hypothetical protein